MRCSETFLLFILAVVTSSEPQFPVHNFQNQNVFPNNFPESEPDDLRQERFFYFDIDLFKAIADHQPEGNILISPLSIKSVLAMVLEGSQGETAEEIRSALRLPNNEGVREQFHNLLAAFQQPQGYVDLIMANRIFVTNDYRVVDTYRNKVQKYYFADIERLDTNNPSTSARRINDWVRQATRDTIPNLVDEGNAKDIKILLANALYFKGKWEKKFSEYGTKNNCFFLSNDACQPTPMMDVVDNFKYDEVPHLHAKVVEIPYTGGEYSMVVILPNKRHGIRQLQRDIRNSIDSIVRNLNETEVFITLPRFKINYNLDLISYLPKVHINSLQSAKAEITGIAVNIATRVSNLLHKTFMEVNEEGTVASAASGAVVIPLMGTTKPRFKADHPFLFFIRHIPTGTILFEGRIMQPEVANVQSTQQPNQAPPRMPNPQQNLQPTQQNVNTQKNPQVRPQNQRPTQLNHQNNFPGQSTGFSNSNQQPSVQPISTQTVVPRQPSVSVTNFPSESFGIPPTVSQQQLTYEQQQQQYYQANRQQQQQQQFFHTQSDDANVNGLTTGKDIDSINFPDNPRST